MCVHEHLVLRTIIILQRMRQLVRQLMRQLMQLSGSAGTAGHTSKLKGASGMSRQFFDSACGTAGFTECES